MEIGIRPAKPEDYDRIEQLSLLCSQEPKWNNVSVDTAEDTYIPLQKIDPELVLVAYASDNKVIGYLTSDDYDVEKQTVAIETVFVHRDYRRQGIGGKLVDHFSNYWIDKKKFHVHLYAVGYDSFEFFQSIGGWKFKWAKLQKSP